MSERALQRGVQTAAGFKCRKLILGGHIKDKQVEFGSSIEGHMDAILYGKSLNDDLQGT